MEAMAMAQAIADMRAEGLNVDVLAMEFAIISDEDYA